MGLRLKNGVFVGCGEIYKMLNFRKTKVFLMRLKSPKISLFQRVVNL